MAGKPLKVVDITRDDKARALAVLARTIEGEDPRIPLEFIESGAERDRKQRTSCMNAIMESSGVSVVDSKTGQEKKADHIYELHCGNAEGADRQLLCTLKSGHAPIWGEKLGPAERTVRLASQGIKYNTKRGRFEPLFSREKWRDKLRESLKQPVETLVKDLSDGESLVREESFRQRILPLSKGVSITTPANLYECLAPEIRSVLPPEAFTRSFSPLTFEEQQEVIKTFQKAYDTGLAVSYMDLPAVMAIELHRAFMSTPTCWDVSG